MDDNSKIIFDSMKDVYQQESERIIVMFFETI